MISTKQVYFEQAYIVIFDNDLADIGELPAYFWPKVCLTYEI